MGVYFSICLKKENALHPAGFAVSDVPFFDLIPFPKKFKFYK